MKYKQVVFLGLMLMFGLTFSQSVFCQSGKWQKQPDAPGTEPTEKVEKTQRPPRECPPKPEKPTPPERPRTPRQPNNVQTNEN